MEPAVHFQEMLRFGSCKTIAAECNDDDDLPSRLDAPCPEDALYIVGGNKVLGRNNFSTLPICRFGNVANKEQASGRIPGLYDNFRIMDIPS